MVFFQFLSLLILAWLLNFVSKLNVINFLFGPGEEMNFELEETYISNESLTVNAIAAYDSVLTLSSTAKLRLRFSI